MSIETDKEETLLTMFFLGLSCLIIGLLLNMTSERDNDLLNWKGPSNLVDSEPK